MDRNDRDDDDERPRLQSLAQAARTNQLKQVRNTLLAIGIVTVIANLIGIFLVPSQVRDAIAKQGPVLVAPGAPPEVTILLTVGYVAAGVGILLGLLFIGFGALVYSFPVPITITSLVLYILTSVACFIANIGVGSIGFLIVRIFFIIALVKAVQTAFAYQKELRLAKERAADDLDDDYD